MKGKVYESCLEGCVTKDNANAFLAAADEIEKKITNKDETMRVSINAGVLRRLANDALGIVPTKKGKGKGQIAEAVEDAPEKD